MKDHRLQAPWVLHGIACFPEQLMAPILVIKL
jgi:hypothetical protein